jgi:hypothetical protein
MARARAALAALEAGNGSSGASVRIGAQDLAAADTLPRARYALAQVRYFTRFLEEVDAMEEEALG